jgi:hypothetical protein
VNIGGKSRRNIPSGEQVFFSLAIQEAFSAVFPDILKAKGHIARATFAPEQVGIKKTAARTRVPAAVVSRSMSEISFCP